jgi:predicted DNA-binding transcriptional regulator AlpA
MAAVEYVHILKPSITHLERCQTLLLTSREMADFLGVPAKVVHQLVYHDRIPLPMRLGLGSCSRWNIFELLDWVQAGCPRRTQWIAMRGTSGWYPMYRWGQWWMR